MIRFCLFARRLFTLLAILTAFLFFLFLLKLVLTPSPLGCYTRKSKSLPSVSDFNPVRDGAIFFIETSCISDHSGKIVITARQACAVESAAMLNPTLEIYLLFLSPGKIEYDGSKSDRFLKELMKYQNVKISRLHIEDFIKDTPVEDLWKNGKIQVPEDASDILRFLVLWKYGGIYLDLDVIVKKPLEGLAVNFAGLQQTNVVGSSVLSFDSEGQGHDFASHCLRDLAANFKSKEVSSKDVMTRLYQTLCDQERVKKATGAECSNFHFHPPEFFYAVLWHNWTMLFDEEYVNKVEDLTENSYVVHWWHNFSYNDRVSVGAHVPYVLHAEKYCQMVFRESNGYF